MGREHKDCTFKLEYAVYDASRRQQMHTGISETYITRESFTFLKTMLDLLPHNYPEHLRTIRITLRNLGESHSNSYNIRYQDYLHFRDYLNQCDIPQWTTQAHQQFTAWHAVDRITDLLCQKLIQ